MNTSKPMTLLLLEDDKITTNEFEKYIATRTDVTLVAKTNSSIDALKLVKKHRPEAVIVDLELQDGLGSGFDFLQKLKNTNLNFSPLIVVNTNVKSPTIYKNLHDGYVDLIFYKQQADYSFEMLVNAIVFSRKHEKDYTHNIVIEESEEEEQLRITKLINIHLDRIGISYKLKGREYIFDAINFMLHENPEKFKEISPLQYVANKHHMFSSSVGRAIQTAINDAWKKTAIEDLERFYTASINSNSGVPTAMELIFYFYNKIKEEL